MGYIFKVVILKLKNARAFQGLNRIVAKFKTTHREGASVSLKTYLLGLFNYTNLVLSSYRHTIYSQFYRLLDHLLFYLINTSLNR
jgi:hypothetical protein